MAERLNAAADGLQQVQVGNLHLAYLKLGERRKLRVGCADAYPTAEQLVAVLAAFHVPPEPTVTPGRMKSQAPKSGRWFTLHYYDVCWREIHAATVAQGTARR